jgi:O-antigen/teichoic acid export membrane protein
LRNIFNNKIASNLFSLTSAELAKRLLGFLSLAYLGRVLDPSGFGIMGFASAFVSYFALFIDFGFNTLGTREIAKDHNVMSKYVNGIISLRLILASALFLILVVYITLSDLNNVTKYTILITGVSLYANAINLSWVFQAVEQMQHIAIRQILAGALSLTGIIVFVHSETDLLIAAAILTVSALLGNLWFIPIYKKLFAQIKLHLNYQRWKELLIASFPLAFSAMMINIYYNLDMVMLGYMKTESDVGIYNAAYKIFMLSIIPIQLILSAFFPALSRIGLKYSNEFSDTLKNYGLLTVGAGVIAGIILFLFSDEIIFIIFGEKFYNSAAPLSILAFNTIIIGINSFTGNPLVAWGKLKSYSIAVSFGAISNMILNLILIPIYSYNGAAIATLLSEITVLVGLFYLFKRHIFGISAKNVE